MMLNLQFAETMELTEAELQEVSGGDLVYNANIPGGGNWGGIGSFWRNSNFADHFFNFKKDSDPDRRRYY